MLEVYASDDTEDYSSFPFIDSETKTVNLPAQTVKLVSGADEFKRALSTAFTCGEIKAILRLCLLYDSGAHAVGYGQSICAYWW